ncbi:MAG TPA: MogA/MoaB family molybdenum cofactor biosynthesis protein [Candidatus Angelobacter sp.]|jgi:molybdenum cofactor synthesis domain-containing protein|nr:MogA/MoaB family molybdenum cofactor biosynthesis protein [Candidatus Angelobacter sp.]
MTIAAVVTISDSVARGKRADRSGPATVEVLRQHGFDVTQQRTVVDDQDEIERTLIQLSGQVRLIVTTGGTGISERDLTPEATRAVCSKLIDGIPEKIRAEGSRNTAFAILSRGLCGVCGGSLVLNLPGNPAGAVDSLQSVIEILPHALDLLAGKTEHEQDGQ